MGWRAVAANWPQLGIPVRVIFECARFRRWVGSTDATQRCYHWMRNLMSLVTQQMTRVGPVRNAARYFNIRLLILGIVVLGPLGWIVYTFAKLSLGGGIEQVGEYKQVDLKALGNFPFNDTADNETAVPPLYRNLDGKKVLLIGQMYSDSAASATVDNFQLVYSIANCCFGGPPKVQERVFVHTPAGRKFPLYDGQANVYGTLHVRAIRDGGKVVSVYDMDVQKITPVQ